jgi:hypothetical protein
MTLLKTWTEVGMPWHGKALDNVLTTPAGNKTINGTGGCIPVRHPAAPGVSRSPEQVARDTAQGHTWRNYGLLCGNARAFNGGPEIGATKWLYCQPDGRTWVMEVVTSVSGADLTIEIWRRALFRVFGRQYTTTDQKVGETTITFTLPPEYTGTVTAAQCAANASVDKASQIVPNPAGNSVFVHVTCTNGVYDATTANFEASVPLRQVFAIVQVTLSGNGDPTIGGAGITAAFPNTDTYEALRTESVDDLNVGDFPPAGWGDCSCVFFDPNPDPPTAAGQTKTTTNTCTVANSGEQIFHRTASGFWRDAIIYRTHLGDVVVRARDYIGSVDEHEVSGGPDVREDDYVSVEGPPGVFSWGLPVATRYTTSAWVSNTRSDLTGPGSDRYTVQGQQIKVSVGAFVFDYEWDIILEHRKIYVFANSSCEGGGWPRTLPPEESFPTSFISNLGVLSGGMSFTNIDMVGGLTIHPGYIQVSAAYDNLNNDGDRHYINEFVGIGEVNFVNFASNVLDYTTGVQPPPISERITTHAWQPVDEVGEIGIGSVPSLKYC